MKISEGKYHQKQELAGKLNSIWLAVFTTLIPNFTAVRGRDYVDLPKWLDWSNQRKMLIDNLLSSPSPNAQISKITIASLFSCQIQFHRGLGAI